MLIETHKRRFGLVVALSVSIVASSCTYSDGAGDQPSTTNAATHPQTDGERAVELFQAGDRQLHEAWYDSSLVSYRAAAELFELSKDWRGFVRARIGEASALERLSQFSDGLKVAREAEEAARTLVGDSLLEARARDGQAENLIRLGRYDEAMEVIESALEIKYGIEPNLYEISKSLFLKGWLTLELSRPDSAIKILNASGKDLGQEDTKDLALLARTYNTIGNAYNWSNDYDQAINYLEQSLSLKELIYSKTHPQIAYALGNLSNNYRRLGKARLALENYSRALSIFLSRTGYAHFDVAVALGNIGQLYMDMGEIEKAELAIEKSLSIFHQLVGLDHTYAATVLGLKGELKYVSGDFAEAIEYLNSGLSTKYKLTSSYDWGLQTLVCEAKAALEMQDALACIELVVENVETLNGESDFKLANAYRALGSIASGFGRQHVAEQAFGRAIKILERRHGDTLLLTRVSYDYSKFLFRYGRFQESKAVSDIILSGPYDDDSNLGSLHVQKLTFDALLQRADAKFELFRHRADFESGISAINDFTSAAVVSNVRTRHRNPNVDSNYLLPRSIPDKLASILQFELTETRRSIEMIFRYCELSRNRSIQRSVLNQNLLLSESIPEVLLDLEAKLSEEILSFSNRLKISSTDTTTNRYRRQLISATQSYDSLITVFEQEYPKYYRLKHSSQTASIVDVQNHLSDREALIEYVVGIDSTYAFAITANSV
ncbi:MAG: tetratricopeptide repeat protein, partial [Rhodothermales bacterium]|nr:tetratricopeptide repeat protein [Rhodothermales bacterium]